MKPKIILGILLISMILLLSGCAKTGSNSKNSGNINSSISPNGTSSNVPSNSGNLAGSSVFNPATTKAINIKDDSFDPVVVQVVVGDTITWTNTVQIEHSIKAEIFSSGNLRQGETFSYQFPTAGTYDYACGLHPDMTGQIIVK